MSIAAEVMQVRRPEFTLAADGKTLPAERTGWLTPTDPAIGVDAIRRRYQDDGYVWLKRLLPRTDVLDFRRWVFERLAETGLVEPGSDFSLGIASAAGFDRSVQWYESRVPAGSELLRPSRRICDPTRRVPVTSMVAAGARCGERRW